MLTKDEIKFCIEALEDYAWEKKRKARKLIKHIEVLEARNRIKKEDSKDLILQEKVLSVECKGNANQAEFIIKKLKKEL